MRQPHTDSPAPKAQQTDYRAASVIVDISDTTWRLFVPTVSLLLLGRYIDVRYGIKPIAMLVGFTLGSIIAGWLIKRQLTRVS